MFFETERLPIVQRMILADKLEDRQAAIHELLPYQRADFDGLFEAMDGLPVIIRLIDPPRASSKPVAPNRLVLLPLGLLFAIAGGFLAAFLASQVRPVFYDGKSLRDETGLPVLGIVSLLPNEARSLQERTSVIRFMLGSGTLVIAYAIGIALLTQLSRAA